MQRLSRWWRAAAALVVVAAFAIAAGAGTRADAQARASATTTASLVLRVLSYDRALRARSPTGRVRVLAVYRTSETGARASCEATARAIGLLGRSVKVSGMNSEATAYAYSSPQALAEAGRGFQALYVCGSLDGTLSVVSQAARRLSLLSISEREDYVRGGLSVGIVSESRLRLVVNMTAATAEGARLDPALLRIATVLR